MFEVLVFVYENYYSGADYPDPAMLKRKLNAVGFEQDEIGDAVSWLNDLNAAARGSQPIMGPLAPTAGAQPLWLREPQATSTRVYSAFEQRQLGLLCMGYLSFLETADLLTTAMREVVIDRALATPGGTLDLNDLKTIVLMVYWSFGVAPGELLLDELCDDGEGRIAH